MQRTSRRGNTRSGRAKLIPQLELAIDLEMTAASIAPRAGMLCALHHCPIMWSYGAAVSSQSMLPVPAAARAAAAGAAAAAAARKVK